MTISAPSLSKWAVLDAVGWKPHNAQLQIAESTARHRVFSCGRRFGKSDLGGHELLPEAFLTKTMQAVLKEQRKRREFWIVGPEYTDSEKEFRVLYNELSRLEVPFDRPGTYNDPISGNLHISLWQGAFQVHGKSAKYPSTLVGEGLSGVIMAEAAKMKPIVWTKFIRPTLADFDGWSIHSSTPEGKNHFYELWQSGQDPENPNWDSWRMPAWRNHYVYKTPTLDKHVRFLQKMMEDSPSSSPHQLAKHYELIIDSEILDQLTDLTGPMFNQELAADFTEFVGRVFKEFDEEIHVGDLQFDPSWQTWAGVDYGYTNPNVWLLIQVGPWGEVNILDEVYKPGLDANEFADEIIRRGLCPAGLRGFFPDPASPGDTRILQSRLRVPAYSGTGGELKHRIDGIRKGFKFMQVDTETGPTPGGHGILRPQIMINRKCTMTIHDFNEYRYPETKEQNSIKSQELPMKKDDHAPEAFGRFWKGFWGTPQDIASGTRVSKGKFARR